MEVFLLGLLVGSFVIQIGFYLLIFSRLAFWQKNNTIKKESDFPISVIICARNEANNLKENLPAVFAQKYVNFEVVLVNDRSTDETAAVLAHFAENNSHAKVVHIPDNVTTDHHKGKKFALSKGIQAAKYDYILLTDADCKPASPHWISAISTHFTSPDFYQVVLGYSPYEFQNTFLNRCIQYETMQTALHYLSFALAKMPYMGVGRNLAYHKTLFFDEGGFDKHQHIASGDDDLFVNAVANGKNTTISIEKEAICYSKPAETWEAWYHQKTRHYSTASHYQQKHQLFLGAIALSHFVFYVMLGAVLILYSSPSIAIALAVIRLLVQLLIYTKIKKILLVPLRLVEIILFDVLYVLYYVVFAPALFVNKTVKWRNQVL